MWPHCDCKWHKSNLHVRVPFSLSARGQMWMHRTHTHTQHTIWLMVYWWKIAKSQIVDCVKLFPFVGQSKASVKLSQSSLLFLCIFFSTACSFRFVLHFACIYRILFQMDLACSSTVNCISNCTATDNAIFIMQIARERISIEFGLHFLFSSALLCKNYNIFECVNQFQ